LLATRQTRRPKVAGWIGDAIYGINDGLGSIFGIVSGVSGATLGNSKSGGPYRDSGHDRQRAFHGFGRHILQPKVSERFTKRSTRANETRWNTTNPRLARFCLSVIKSVGYQQTTPIVLSTKLPETRPSSSSACARTIEHHRRCPPQTVDLGNLRFAFDSRRRHHSHRAVLFLTGYPAVIAAAVISLLAHFVVGAGQIPDHDPFLVVQRT